MAGQVAAVLWQHARSAEELRDDADFDETASEGSSGSSTDHSSERTSEQDCAATNHSSQLFVENPTEDDDFEKETSGRSAWEPLPLVRVLPLRPLRAAICCAAFLNVAICIPSVRQDFASSSPDGHWRALMLWVGFLAGFVFPVLVQVHDFWHARPRLNLFYTASVAWMPSVNQALYQISKDPNLGWIMGRTPTRWDDYLVYFGVLWTVLTAFLYLHVPTHPVALLRRHHGFAYLGHLAATALIVTAAFLHTWMAEEVQKQLLVAYGIWSALQSETVIFMQTGDATGCRVLALAMVLYQVQWAVSLAHFFTSQSHLGFRWVLNASVLVAVVLHIATIRGGGVDRLRSTVPMRKGASSLAKLVPICGPLLAWLRSWRGVNCMYAANALLSFIVYVELWKNAQYQDDEETRNEICTNLEEDRGIKHPCAPHFVKAIICACILIMILAGWNLTKEWAARTNRLPAILTIIPADKYFHIITWAKLFLMWTKLLLFRFMSSSPTGASPRWVMLQVLCIAASSVMMARNTLTMLGHGTKLSDLKQFPYPRMLWRTLQIQIATCIGMTTIVLVSHAVLASSDPQFFSQITVVQVFPCVYILGNEAAVCISTQAFPEYRSPRALRAMVTFLAYFMPLSCIEHSLQAGPGLHVFKNVWLWKSSWLAGVMGWGFFFMCLCNFAIAWAAGATD